MSTFVSIVFGPSKIWYVRNSDYEISSSSDSDEKDNNEISEIYDKRYVGDIYVITLDDEPIYYINNDKDHAHDKMKEYAYKANNIRQSRLKRALT